MRKTKIIAACVLGALLLIAALGRFVPISYVDPARTMAWLSGERQRAEEEAQRQTAAEDLRKRLLGTQDKVKGLFNDAHSQMLETVKSSRAKAAEIIVQQRAAIPGLTAKADEKIQGYGNAMGLARRMAMDKVRGTHQTQEYLQAAFQPIVHDEALAQARIRLVLKDCADQLNLQAAKLQADTAQVLDAAGFKASDLGLEKSLERLASSQTHVLKASMSAAVATLEVVIEAALVQTTYQAVSSLLAKAVAKEVTSLAIGAEGAPIPVADIVTTLIAIGGTAWTAYDVHHAVEELKKIDPLIRSGLEDSINQLDQKTKEGFSSLETAVAVLCNAS